MTQHEMILRHLKNHGSITSTEAFAEYGVTRLAAVVYTLKDRGCDISTTMEEGINRFGEKYHFARYYYRGESNGYKTHDCA